MESTYQDPTSACPFLLPYSLKKRDEFRVHCSVALHWSDNVDLASRQLLAPSPKRQVWRSAIIPLLQLQLQPQISGNPGISMIIHVLWVAFIFELFQLMPESRFYEMVNRKCCESGMFTPEYTESTTCRMSGQFLFFFFLKNNVWERLGYYKNI